MKIKFINEILKFYVFDYVIILSLNSPYVMKVLFVKCPGNLLNIKICNIVTCYMYVCVKEETHASKIPKGET